MKKMVFTRIVYAALAMCFSIIICNSSFSAEQYVFQKKWPVLEQPWYFASSYDIVVDSLGNIYVVDDANHCVQKFSSNGTFISKWGVFGFGDGK